jgi:hypothetical protein
MKNVETEWSKLFQYRDRIHRQYREIWDVPLIKRRSEVLKSAIKDGDRLLDVGAGMKGVKEELAKLGIQVSYRSMDIDRHNEHDYYDLDDIRETFDAITLFEVIEHLSLADGLTLLRRLNELTTEGGVIVLSTPNIFNPSRFMRDSTHKTFYAYDELCGLLNLAGYGIRGLYRSYNDAFHRYIMKVYLCRPLFKLLSIDFAYSIFAVAEKERRA